MAPLPLGITNPVMAGRLGPWLANHENLGSSSRGYSLAFQIDRPAGSRSVWLALHRASSIYGAPAAM
jgi:hypothetical protein